jgi:hypothetical protein
MDKIIECDGEYRIDEKCLGYRLQDEYRERKLTPVQLLDRILMAKVQRALGEKNSAGRLPVHGHLERFLRQLTIDQTLAARLLGGRQSRRKRHARDSVAMIEARRFRLEPDVYGRVHTNITNLWSPLRKALRWKGRELAELDIANCQPLILGLMASQIELETWDLDGVKALGSVGLMEVPGHPLISSATSGRSRTPRGAKPGRRVHKAKGSKNSDGSHNEGRGGEGEEKERLGGRPRSRPRILLCGTNS